MSNSLHNINQVLFIPNTSRDGSVVTDQDLKSNRDFSRFDFQ